MEFHPIANCFPLIDGNEFDELVADVKAHGVHEPVIVYEGMILDGRNRYRATQIAGVDCPMVMYGGDDPVGFVVSLNLRRRHLDEIQRGWVSAQIANLKKGSNQHTAIAAPSQAEVARMMNVSVDSVQRAKVIKDHGVAELQAKIAKGEVSLAAAAEVARLPEAEQQEIVAKGEKEIQAMANALKREKKKRKQEERRKEIAELAEKISVNMSPDSRCQIHHSTFMEALNLPEGSVDFIITDPPYPQEFLHVFNGLGQVAAHVLKPGGSLLCMSGQSWLPEIYSSLSKHLTYNWTLSYLTPGGQATQVFPRKVNTFWKPILWFTKGAYQGDWIGDVSKSDTNDNDKNHHFWGQSESGMLDLMRRFVVPGDVVMDTFMGGGTTGLVALRLGATFIGYDTDEDAYNTSKVRLADAAVLA